MAFLETPRFPERIARNMIGGPEFATEVVVLASGHEARNANWSQARRRYDAAIAVRTLSDFAEVEQHFHAVSGRHHGFRFKDFGDASADSSNGLLRPLHGTVQVGSAGFGYGVPSYQLVKRYARGTLTHDRDIRKPVAGTVTVRRGGVAVTFGGAAGQIALDTASGIVTFVADATRSINGVTVGAATQLQCDSALPGIVIGDRIYVTGLSGADAALLNNLSHAVTNIVGNVYTVSTNTAGKTVTPGAGAVAAYPQADEALDWAGQFDVPVRFDTDRLRRRLLTRDAAGQYLVDCDEIPLVEIRV